MEPYETDSPPARDSKSGGPTAEWQAACKNLRNLFHCLAIGMLVLTGTFFMYLLRETMVTRRQSTELAKFAQEYEGSHTAEVMKDFQAKLFAYAHEHPDFRPIYLKYFGTNVVETPNIRPAAQKIDTDTPGAIGK
jgi:hypothetical protein